jgi:hypothetical protein
MPRRHEASERTYETRGTLIALGRPVPHLKSSTEEFRMLYVDPAAGSIALQLAFAAIVGGAITAKRWWGAVKRGLQAAVKHIRAR